MSVNFNSLIKGSGIHSLLSHPVFFSVVITVIILFILTMSKIKIKSDDSDDKIRMQFRTSKIDPLESQENKDKYYMILYLKNDYSSWSKKVVV